MHRRERPRSPLRLLVRLFAGAVVVGGMLALAGVAALPLWPQRPYRLDLLSHFAIHAVPALSGLAAISALLRWRRTALLGLAAALFAAAVCAGFYQPPRAAPASAPGSRLRVLTYNAHIKGSADRDLQRYLERQDADLMAVQEAPWDFVAANPWLAERYPYRVEPVPGMQWPILLFSKFPIRPAFRRLVDEEHLFSFVAARTVIVTLDDGTELLFTSTHPPSPRSEVTWSWALSGLARDGALLRRKSEDLGLPVIIAGDFNSTPTGRGHRAFRQSSGLVGWAPLLPNRGTWPVPLPSLLSVAIDRVWTSPSIVATSVETGPMFESDHRPLTVDLWVPSGPAAAL
ncbi:MAG: endonuclease/exonuclease/phosphatase family protein [Phycisphaerales bacterium]|nr:endonuclease/exonuclease/phosphatase family protein [Phycisphaerales bacterium]